MSRNRHRTDLILSAFLSHEQCALLTDHGNVSSRREGLHEGFCAGLCDGTEVVDQVGLGHTDTGIPDGEGALLLVGGDPDVEVLLSLQL